MRWSCGGSYLQNGGGRSEPDREFEGGRSTVRVDTEELWVADITYVTIATGFVYLAAILDAWSLECAPGAGQFEVSDLTG